MRHVTPPHYEIRTFGRLEIAGPDGMCALRPAHRRLLSILLLASGRDLERDTLIDRVWPHDPPPSARNAIQVYVSAIRKQVPGLVESTPDGYRLHLDGHRLDVDEFGRAGEVSREAANDGDWDQAVDACSAALRLWRGPPFSELADDEFAVAERSRLTELRLGLMERRAQGLLALGRAEEAVPELEKLVVAHPFRERLWEHLMVGRYRLGRQAEALRAYRDAAAFLGEELGIEPGPRLRRLEEEILLQQEPIGGDTGPPRTNLPRAATSFIGRDDAVDEVSRMVHDHRMVTITGPPGIGKTRLAVEVGRTRLDHHQDGVWLVDLSAAGGPSDVSAGIAATLGVAANVADLRGLAGVLAGRDALLILDECAHVHLAVRRFVAGLDEHDAALRVLATSRQRLVVDAETVFGLGPLDVPAHSSGDALASPAVRLLLDRMRAVAPRLPPDDATVAALIELSRRSDGIPLALELAARWVHSGGFEGPTGAHDVSLVEPLRAALDASFEFIAASDRTILVAASVFAGPIGIDDIGGVCAPAATRRELLGVVSRLIESSLIQAGADTSGDTAYTMLHPVREHCQNRLTRDERDALAVGHARWFASRSSELSRLPHARIGELMPDIRAAVRTLADRGDAADVAALALAVRAYWDATYLTWEASEWLEDILGRADPSVVGLDTLIAAGWAAYLNHDYERARTRYRLALTLASDGGDVRIEGLARFGLGRIEIPIAPAEAERSLDQALRCFRDAGASRDEAACHLALGVGLAWRGAAGEARPHLEQCLAALRTTAEPELESVGHRYLSLCAWYLDDEEAAADHADRAEAIARDAGDERRLSGALIQRSLVAVGQGDLASAAGAALEAFGPIPTFASIDLALVSFGAVPALIEAGEFALAGDVFAMIDRVFEDYGWMRIDRRSPLAAGLRASVDDAGTVRPAQELRDAVIGVLSALARR